MTDQSESWSTTQESGSEWQLRFLRSLAIRSPAFVSAPILWLIALAFAWNKTRPASLGSRIYLRRILGREPTLPERQKHMLAASHVYFDRVRLMGSGIEHFSVEVEGRRLISDQVALGRGAVLLGAHYGSFEALRALDRELPGLKVRYLMYPEHAEKSTRLLAALNPDLNERIISLANGPMAMIQVYEALENGEFVAFLGDRLPDNSVRAKVDVDFLGGKISVPTSPYMAAMAAKVPIFLSFATWEGQGRYSSVFSRLYDGEEISRNDRARVAQTLAQRYISVVEDMCRRNPYNWFNFFDVWRG